MTFNYRLLRDVASNLIKHFGTQAILRTNRLDPDAPIHKPVAIVTEYAIDIVTPSSKFIDPATGLLIERKANVAISSRGIEDVEIGAGDAVIVNDRHFQIISAERVSPDMGVPLVWRVEIQ